MPDRGRPKTPLVVSADERETLERWSRRRTTAQAISLRSRIILGCATGQTNRAVAARLGINEPTVCKWRQRFLERRLEGLSDEPRPGPQRKISDEMVERIVVKTLEQRPKKATHWST